MFKTSFSHLCTRKHKRLRWLNCVQHSILAGSTKTCYSLHALVSVETQVRFFQLIGCASLLLGFD